jgi:putative transposase
MSFAVDPAFLIDFVTARPHDLGFKRDRLPLLGTAERRDLILKVIEQMRNRYRFGVVGYVVMPEHVHLLISEPSRGDISSLVSGVKLGFTRRVLTENPHFWQNRREVGRPDPSSCQHLWLKRFYDFNVWSQRKETEKLHYMHQNPVARGLVERSENWKWSSFRSYATGEPGIVRINDWSWMEGKIRAEAG